MAFFDFLKPKPAIDIAGLKSRVISMAFPGGEEQIDRETGTVQAMLNNTYPADVLRNIYTHMALLFYMQQRSKEQIDMLFVRKAFAMAELDVATMPPVDFIMIYKYIQTLHITGDFQQE